MIYLTNIQSDTTLYEISPLINAGDDSILELIKSEFDVFNSRILIQFDVAAISASIQSGEIGANPTYTLRLFSTNPHGLPEQYNLKSYMVSGSWAAGTNEFFDTVDVLKDANWEYINDSVKWATGSYEAGITGSYVDLPGGGNWHTALETTQSFNHESADLNMDVTAFMNGWLDSTYDNNGMIIKRTDESEQLTYESAIKWFSQNTNTIYSPVLEIKWDDTDYITGSIVEVSGNQIVVNATNLNEIYNKKAKSRIRLMPRPKYPAKTFSTQSSYRTPYILSSSSSYSVVDSVTRESIIAFDDIYTRISADSEGSYFDLRMSNFPEERWLELKVKTKTSYGESYYVIGSFKVNK